MEGREGSRVVDSRGQEVSETEVLGVDPSTEGLRGHSERSGFDPGREGKLLADGWGRVCLPGWQVQEIIITTVSRT